MRLQVRWGLCQSFLMLKEHEPAFQALLKALEKDDNVGNAVMAIEAALPSELPYQTRQTRANSFDMEPAPATSKAADEFGTSPVPDVNTKLEQLTARLREVEAELADATSAPSMPPTKKDKMAELDEKLADVMKRSEQIDAKLREIDTELA